LEERHLTDPHALIDDAGTLRFEERRLGGRPVASGGVHDHPDAQAARATFLNNMFGLAYPDQVNLVVAPLYHTAVVNFAQAALHAGHRVVLMDKWTPEGMLERIERYRVTSSHMVPTMFNRLLKLPEDVRKAADVSSLRCMIHSAAPCPIPTKRAMLDWWGPIIHEYYAGTEGNGFVYASPEGRPPRRQERPR
jgi:long-chain acyl-CoA synthetase